MNIEELRAYCLAKPGVTEDMPFGDDTLVFKVLDKMFALANLVGDLSVNLKCEPEMAIQLRENYQAVLPGYHMNKKHWNTVLFNGSVPEMVLKAWIDDSYGLVVEKLTKQKRQELGFT